MNTDQNKGRFSDTIMIVDDSEENLKLLSDVLGGEGYEIRPAGSAELALRSIRAKSPALVVLDIRMPGMDGFELLKILKTDESTSQIPVIICSSLGNESDKIKGLKLGAADYISKPFNKEEIVARVALHFNLRNAYQKLKLAKENIESCNRSLFSDMIEGVMHGRMVLDGQEKPDFIFLYANNSFEKLMGFKNVVNKRMSELVPGIMESDPELFDAFDRVVKTGLPETFETYIKAMDMWLAISIYHPEKGEFIALFNGISERKKREEALITEREQAKAANVAKSRFLANMSHELRTPMNGILGFSSLLSLSKLDDNQADCNEMIKRSAFRLLDLINDVLDFSKLEVKKIKLDKKPFDICRTVSNSVKFMDVLANKKNLTISYSFDANLNYAVIGDQLRIKQILLNLLSNAVKFSKSGTIHVKLSEISSDDKNSLIRMSVSDEGIGFDPEKTCEIFERFHQLDETSTKSYGGAGLGLSIAKGFIELMEGSISVKSEPGKGSIFAVEIPFEKTMDRLECASEKINKHIRLSNGAVLNILLAEDDEICSEFISALSRTYNWKLTVAKNGSEAFKLYKSQRFDAILMDGQMPEATGFEVTEKIRELELTSGEHIPIIALTAYAMKGDREKFIDAGMDDYISKPITNESVILETVMRYISL